MAQVGVVTEQGDLGLGFDPLRPKDEKVYNESVERHEKEDKEKNNNK